MRIVSATPTVFFVHDAGALRQRVDLTLESGAQETAVALSVRGGGIDERIPLADLPPGRSAVEVYLPDVREPVALALGLWARGTLRDEKPVDWQPQKHWEIYLVHYSHHDLGYTDIPGNVLAEHARFLDEVVRYACETQDWPEDERFHWLVEQAWSVDHFARTRTDEAVGALMDAARRGQVEVTALFGNQTLELCGHEELIRLLYPSFELKRKYGVEIVSAEHNDIPGFSWGLASVLAGAGVRYFSPGIPLWYFGRGEDRVHPLWDPALVLDMEIPGAFWWEGIDGARVLLWHDLHGGEWQPTSYTQALRELPELLGKLDEHGHPYDMVSYTVRGGHRDNAPPSLRYAYIAREWNRRWAYPRLINANNQRFLGRFEERWGHTLKTLRGDVPGTDYSTGATGTARELALNRNTHDWLLAAEKLATIASLVAGYEYPKATIDEAYRNTMYFDEHCWGMSHPGGSAQVACFSEKGGFAYRAATLAEDVTVKAANRIVDAIDYPDEGYSLTVFNPLSWPRTDVVRAPLHAWHPSSQPMYWMPPAQEGDGPALVTGTVVGRSMVHPPAELFRQPFELIDVASGRPVAYQLAEVRDPQAAQPWAAERVAMGKVDPRHVTDLAFVAEDLPPMGYRTYRVVPCQAWPAYAASCTATPTAVENRFFRLELNAETGAVSHLWDKALSRDLVDSSAAHGFAQLVARWCETGQEETGRVAGITVGEDGPVYTTLRLKGAVAGCPAWTEELTLYHTLKRVEVSARVLRDSTPNLELYLAFPFRVEAPRFRFEATGVVIEPLRDQLPGTNTDYYAVQHWAEVRNDEYGIVWTSVDAPMAEFGGLWPGYVSGAHHGVTPPGYGHPFLQPGELNKGHIYSMLMYNNFRTNFVNVHPGETLFRFAFSTEGPAPEFGWAASNPPLPVWMAGPKAGPLAATASFCRVDAPNVMLLALKRAEDGNGLIARLMETEGREAVTTLTVPGPPLVEVYATNLVEENQGLVPCAEHAVQAKVRPYGFTTLRLITQ